MCNISLFYIINQWNSEYNCNCLLTVCHCFQHLVPKCHWSINHSIFLPCCQNGIWSRHTDIFIHREKSDLDHSPLKQDRMYYPLWSQLLFLDLKTCVTADVTDQSSIFATYAWSYFWVNCLLTLSLWYLARQMRNFFSTSG